MKAKRKGAEPTVTPKANAVAHDPAVVNWARSRHRQGVPTKQIVKLSKTAEDYPRPGQPLSDGTLGACDAAILHLEAQGARFPLENGGKLNGKQKAPLGKRLYEVGQKRAAARKAQPAGHVLWDTAYEVTKRSSLLMSLEFEDLELDQHDLDTIGDLHTDLLIMREWEDRILWNLEVVIGEQGLRKKIEGLRAKTVERGATVEEAETAARMAERLEQRLSRRLSE